MTDVDDADQVEQARLMIGCAWCAILAGVACAIVLLVLAVGAVLFVPECGGAA